MSNIFQTCLKGFKLQIMVVEPKTTQVVEPHEEPVDQFSSISQGVQKLSLSSRMIVQLVKVEPQPVEIEPQAIEV